MYFDIHGNLTPPVTLLPSTTTTTLFAYLHGDQPNRNTIMVCTLPPSSFSFFLLPQIWYYYHYEICNSASVMAALRGGRSVKSRARGFYDNCPQEPSDWWLWDMPPPPKKKKNPTPSKCTHEHCVHSQGREKCGGGGKMQSMGERKRGRNGRK